jgi:uncharacterized iron-regulated membrane protein
MALSALVLWWHRRPAGGFAGVPVRFGDRGLPRTVLVGIGALSLALPLLAGSFAVCWLVDRTVGARSGRL